MSRVDDRTVHSPPAIHLHANDAESSSQTGVKEEPTYSHLALRPSRAVVVTVRRVGKIVPRAFRIDEPE